MASSLFLPTLGPQVQLLRVATYYTDFYFVLLKGCRLFALQISLGLMGWRAGWDTCHAKAAAELRLQFELRNHLWESASPQD